MALNPWFGQNPAQSNFGGGGFYSQRPAQRTGGGGVVAPLGPPPTQAPQTIQQGEPPEFSFARPEPMGGNTAGYGGYGGGGQPGRGDLYEPINSFYGGGGTGRGTSGGPLGIGPHVDAWYKRHRPENQGGYGGGMTHVWPPRQGLGWLGRPIRGGGGWLGRPGRGGPGGGGMARVGGNMATPDEINEARAGQGKAPLPSSFWGNRGGFQRTR